MQAYQRKTEKFFVIEEKQFGRIDSSGITPWKSPKDSLLLIFDEQIFLTKIFCCSDFEHQIYYSEECFNNIISFFYCIMTVAWKWFKPSAPTFFVQTPIAICGLDYSRIKPNYDSTTSFSNFGLRFNRR